MRRTLPDSAKSGDSTGTAPLHFRRAGSVIGGGGITINFPNYFGSRQELVEEVRRGLYDIARRNPGALPGVA